jgi:hypothetical protein
VSCVALPASTPYAACETVNSSFPVCPDNVAGDLQPLGVPCDDITCAAPDGHCCGFDPFDGGAFGCFDTPEQISRHDCLTLFNGTWTTTSKCAVSTCTIDPATCPQVCPLTSGDEIIVPNEGCAEPGPFGGACYYDSIDPSNGTCVYGFGGASCFASTCVGATSAAPCACDCTCSVFNVVTPAPTGVVFLECVTGTQLCASKVCPSGVDPPECVYDTCESGFCATTAVACTIDADCCRCASHEVHAKLGYNGFVGIVKR